MEKDLSMLNYAIENKSEDLYVRFYGWKPRCVSFGRNQKNKTLGIKIDSVIRPTGGRALLHDDEITYAIAGKIPLGRGVIKTYNMVSDAIIEGFKNLGYELSYGNTINGNNKYCMNISAGCDICYKGKKLIGSAQYRKEGYFLQHGSILKTIDYKLIEKVFMEPVMKDKIITLKEINPEILDEEVIEALKNGFKNIKG